MSCIEVFAREGMSGCDLQIAVNNEHPNFECEFCRCSEHSPGPVKDEEEVLFLLINPTHFDESTGTLHPIAFQEVHNRDLSLVRREHAGDTLIDFVRNQIVSRSMQKVPPQYRYVNQGAIAKVEDIRNLRDSTGRLFSVYDTALHDNHAHASVFTRNDILQSKPGKMIARQSLWGIFSKEIVDFELQTSSI